MTSSGRGCHVGCGTAPEKAFGRVWQEAELLLEEGFKEHHF